MGRRLAYAAAKQMRRQQEEEGALPAVTAGGAMSGPTIAGCTAGTPRSLEIHFNASLLGGEALLMRDQNSISNASDWALAPGWSGIPRLHDSSGLMVCAVNASAPETGNATTCGCLGWNFFKTNNTADPNNPFANWYCTALGSQSYRRPGAAGGGYIHVRTIRTVSWVSRQRNHSVRR